MKPCVPFLRIGLLGLAILAAPPARAAGPPIQWEPIPADQAARTKPMVEPDADAECLFLKVWVQDEFLGNGIRQTRDYYYRIKVFTERGAETYTRLEIDYPARDVDVRDISARTIAPDGSVTLLDRKAIIKETLAKRRDLDIRRRSFALPGVKPGSIIEYRYQETRWDEAAMIQTYDLQSEIPAQRIEYYIRPLDVEGWFQRQLNFHTPATTSSTRKDGYFETVVQNQPAYHAEPYSPPEYQLRGWMLLYYTQEKLSRPNEYWPKLGRREGEWFDSYIKPDKETEALARQVTAPASADSDKVRLLIDYVQHEFRVVHSLSADSLRAAGLAVSKKARDAIRQKGGSYWDVDMAFASLARAAGLSVRYLRVASREVRFFDPNMMDPYFLPSYLIGIRIGGEWRCFDPTTSSLPWDMVPWNVEATVALLCDRDSSRFIDTPVATPERSTLFRGGALTLTADGSLEGDLFMLLSGHLGATFRSTLREQEGGDADSAAIEQANLRASGVELSKIAIDSPDGARGPLRITCHARFPGFATATSKRLILEPGLFHARQPALFTSSQRHAPVYFQHPWCERDSFRIHLPDGWGVEAVDALEPVRAPGVSSYRNQVLVSDDGHDLLCLRTLTLGENGMLYFPADTYEPLKKLFDLVHDRDRATVTLVRADTKP